MLTKLIVLASAASLALAAQRPRKQLPKVRALLVDPSHNDPNPVTDASICNMHERLRSFEGHLDIEITRMSDNKRFSQLWGPRNCFYPTAENVKTQLQRLVNQSVSGDTIFFVYGGHGGSVNCPANHIIPKAHSKQYLVCTNIQKCGGVIWDHELNTIVRSAKPGVKVLLIIMSCHSGYMARLPFRYDSKNAPTPVTPNYNALGVDPRKLSRSEDDLHRFNARYDAWSARAGWSIPAVYNSIYTDPRTRRTLSVEKAEFAIPDQLPTILAGESQKNPMIICFSAAEYNEIALINLGALPTFKGFGTHSAFTIRMMKYIFGDDKSQYQHRKKNGVKPIGQQFYMTQDSSNIQFHKPVMTSNVRFDISKFSVWDFMTKRVEQNAQGVYHIHLNGSWVNLSAQESQKENVHLPDV